MSKKGQTARSLALTVLTQVFDDGAYSNIALRQELDRSTLTSQDKGLVTELVYGTVARKLTLEWYISHYIADRDKLDSWVYYLLMLSLYQLLYLDKIPVHAVVNEAVNIAKRGKGTDKFVNAILRKMTSEALPDIASIKRKNKRRSIQHSVPVWLVKLLSEEYGDQRADKMMKSLFERSKASVRVVRKEALSHLQKELVATPSILSPVGLVATNGNFTTSSAFLNGEITIQDETSQLVAPTLKLKGTEEVLDACAAPGGKTVHIASYLTTGQVIALDLYDHKLTLIADNARRLGVEDKVSTQKLDARQVFQHFGPDAFDKILVDAPCSGLGLIRRKPDIKYNKKIADFTSLQETQLEILGNVCKSIRKGGIITYSTCTIIQKENQEVIRAFLKGHPNFEQVALNHPCSDILVDGCILITPEQYQTDGFFISQVRRIS